MKSKIDSGRMMSRVASLQEENEALHAQIAMLRKKIAMQEKEIAILKRVCHGSVQDCKQLQK